MEQWGQPAASFSSRGLGDEKESGCRRPDCQNRFWDPSGICGLGGRGGPAGRAACCLRSRQWFGATRRRVGICGQKLLHVAIVLLLVVGSVGGDDDIVTQLQMQLQVGDLLNLRKALSGESTFPDRFRSYVRGNTIFDASLDQCCMGTDCRECSMGEQIENLQATVLRLKEDVSLLRKLGCPCRVQSIFPDLGDFSGGLPAEVTTTGLLLDEAYALGPVECWWREVGILEVYDKTAAVQLGPRTVSCSTPRKSGPVVLEVTLHGSGWAVTSSIGGSNRFEMYERGSLSIASVRPSGSPTHGGAVLKMTGNFDANRIMYVRVAGERFSARILNSTTAYCTTPILPAGMTMLQISQNGFDWFEPGVEFGVYKQPTIHFIAPSSGAGLVGQDLRMNIAGLGAAFQPHAADLFCRWHLFEKNVTYQATRIGNSSTISCPIPNQTFGIHLLTLQGTVEVSLIGVQDEVFTNHGSTGNNRFHFLCLSSEVDSGKCCGAGFFSNGRNCTSCPAGTFSSDGQTSCYNCPAFSDSLPANPYPNGCTCINGYVGSSQGLIQTPSDTCLTCPRNTYAYTTTERLSENVSTATKHGAGIRAVEASCRPCRDFSESLGGVTSTTDWDCSCQAGYICTIGAQTCDAWKQSLELTWSRATCLASNNSDSPSAVQMAACARTGLSAYITYQTVVHPSNWCPNGKNWNGAACVDINECALGTSDCHANAICTNTEGSFECSCARGFSGDGLLDCSDGTQIHCNSSTSLELEVTTAGGAACWATNYTRAWGLDGDFYCDSDAGTTNQIWIRIFWLEVQSWSENILLASGLAVNQTVSKQLDFEFPSSPALVQYRVSGADAWHPADIRVRPGFGSRVWYTPLVPTQAHSLCWVDGDACNELGECFEQEGCVVTSPSGDVGDSWAINPSYTYDFDECALNVHLCSVHAQCDNFYGYYNCNCSTGFYGIGTGVMGSGTLCLPCEAGTFSAAMGMTACTPCPEGTTGPQGSNSVLNCSCKSGFVPAFGVGSAECVLCPADSYCPGGLVAIPCPQGARSPAGSIEVVSCVCSPGWYGPNGGVCTRCPVGHSCEGGRQLPVLCGAGYYAAPGSSRCHPCGNHSESGAGSLLCKCFAGYYDSSFFSLKTSLTCEINGCLPITSQSSCVAAASVLGLGYNFSVPTAQTFGSGIQCLVSNGAAQPKNSSTCSGNSPCVCQSCSPAVCSECSAGTYAAYDSYECKACTANSTSPHGSDQVTDCLCLAGFSGTILSNSSVCRICPPGSFSNEGSAECSLCPPGTYGETSGLSACVDCTGLATTPEGSTSSDNCTCGGGTVADPLGGGCVGINECTEDLHNCNTTATCTDTDSSFVCTCQPSFYGDGITCNPCEQGFKCPGGVAMTPCQPDSYSGPGADACTPCRNHSTSAQQSTSLEDCRCDVGYSAIGLGPCQNLNECTLSTHNCDIGATCADTDGSFLCICPSGYPGDGTIADPCYAVCGDGLRGFGESCDDGNAQGGDGCSAVCSIEAGWTCAGFFSCQDIEECSTSPCWHTPVSAQANASCVELPGSYQCQCPAGTYGNGFQCSACQNFSTSLQNTTSQSGCTCNAGYVASGVGACVNQDECAYNADNCSVYASCADTQGSYTCVCLPGFDGIGVAPDGTLCAEVDECTAGTSNCDAQATCTNTFGSFTCTCRVGYRDQSAGLVGVAAGTSGACAACGPGSYNSLAGAQTCSTCPAGSTTSGNANTCSQCGAGFYSGPNSSTCSPCPGSTTSAPGSDSAAACFCPAGTYMQSGSCVLCPTNAWSASGSIGDASCSCINGSYAASGTSGASLQCLPCASCPPGSYLEGCAGLSAGTCQEMDECSLHIHDCDAANGACEDTDGSFLCFCKESYYGNGTQCTACTEQASSGFGSTDISNCSCNVGFDIGDGITVNITSVLETCYTSLEVQIVTVAGADGQCWTQRSSDYCDVHGGTTADVWIRVQWVDGNWTQWYVLRNRANEALYAVAGGDSFDFSVGGNVTVFLPAVSYVGGPPAVVEYYVASHDSWRPQSVAVRPHEGLPGGGQWFATQGQLCWVDAGGQAYSQNLLNCSYVGQSATASVHGASDLIAARTVGVGLFRADSTPLASNALRHEDLLHVTG